MLTIGIIIFFIGLFFLAAAGINYRWRAFTNKKAWNGIAVPFTIIGLIIFVIGLVIIYINYPQ